MSIVSAFLVPGSPLPLLCPEAAPWQVFRQAMARAGDALRASRPDAVLVYSTQWFAVLDGLWLTRPRSVDTHVDENWHEFGAMAYDLHADVDLAQACIDACNARETRSRGVNYEGFPLDSGTIAATSAMGIGGPQLPLVVAANNLYYDYAKTQTLGAIAAEAGAAAGKRVAVVGVGGLSGSVFTTEITPQQDRIRTPEDDARNRHLLQLLEAGDLDALQAYIPGYAKEARAEMGLKHLAWLLGAMGTRYQGAQTHHYGALYGAGAAVVEFQLGAAL